MREVLVKIFRVLSSRIFLLWLLGAWVLYYVTLAVWSKEAFSSFVAGLGTNPLIWLPFVVFLASALLNLLRAGAGRFREGKARFFLWSVLPAGAFFFVLGFFLSTAFREQVWNVVGEGDLLSPPWQEAAFQVEEIQSPLGEEILDVLSEKPGSSIFRYEPRMLVWTGAWRVSVGVFPPEKIGGTYYHILQFGLAPGLRLLSGGKLVEEGYMLQKILPPGAQDTFRIDPYPYRFALRLAPTRVIEKGQTRAKVFNVKSPTYHVTVLKGEEVLFEGESGAGVEFDGFTLTFTQPVSWVRVEAVKDPGRPLLVAGLALVVAGLPLMFIYLVIRIAKGRARLGAPS